MKILIRRLILSLSAVKFLIKLVIISVQARAGLDYESSYGKVRPNDTILKLQRTTPYYKRNRAHVCSFYIRGECTRGAECPYRHEMPVTGELSQQNIKDRYYGYASGLAVHLLCKTSLISPSPCISMFLPLGKHFLWFSVFLISSRMCAKYKASLQVKYVTKLCLCI